MRAGTRRGARWLAGAWAVAVMLATVAMAGPAQAAPAPFTYSTVAWTHSTVIVAAVNSAGDLYYWWQPDGSTTWNQELVATGQYEGSVPSIAWTGSTVIIANNGTSGNVDYWYQYAGTQGWNEQQVAVSNGTCNYYGPATISWTGSTVIIAAVHVIGCGSSAPTALDYWYQYAGTGTWHPQQVTTGVAYNSYAGPSIGWTGSTVIITDTDTSGNVYYWYQYAGTGTWHPQQVAPASAAGGQWANPVISWTGSTVIIAADDQSGDLNYWYQYAGTGTWHPQQVAAGSVAPYDPPSIAWTGSSVVLAGVSENGSLNFWWQAAGTGSWNEEHVATLSPGGQYFPSSMTAAGDSVVITDSDGSNFPGGNLDYWWQQDGTTGWNQQQVAAG